MANRNSASESSASEDRQATTEATGVKELKFTEDYLRSGDLEIDRRVERPQDPNKVLRIRNAYDMNAIGIISVSKRDNGALIIIDGQHRTEATIQAKGPDELLPCHIYVGLTLEQEADLFLKLNDGTKPRVIDRFPIRVTKQDPAAVAIKDILNQYNWTVGPQAGNGNVNAVAAVERIYDLSVKVEAEPNLVQAVILVVTRAWGQDRFGVQGALFEGLGRLLAEHGSKVDFDKLIERLKGWPGGPFGLHSQATAYARLKRIKVTMAVADLVTEEYNKGRRVNLLPAWGRKV